MGEAAMKPVKNTEWEPSAQDAPDIQGIVVSAYPNTPSAMLLLVKFAGPGAKGWLKDIAQRVTDATGEQPRCINLALSAAGLKEIELDKVDTDVMSTFSRPFQEGITSGHRPRFLGDEVDGKKLSKWDWSDDKNDPNCVHAWLMLYAKDQTALASLVAAETAALARFNLTAFNRILLQMNLDSRGVGHEHFGFADGISQPVLVDGDKVPVEKRALHEIAAGEIVIGQTNTYGVPAPGPVVAATGKTRHLRAAMLHGFADLGRNGTYVVIRQLKQDVAAFWRNMETVANHLVAEQGKPATADWLAEKVVGRTQAGEMLIPGGSAPGNDMAFFETDRAGLGCPVTSHVRRSNPRDGLAPPGKDIKDIIQATNRHRIMRRGRIYGEPIADRFKDDGVDRGLVFICLNSEIDRQFEFVQHTWLLNPMFGGKFKESDPLSAPKCPFSIPLRPVRQQPILETYITAMGGGYFFLPSLSALRYLGDL